MVSLLVLLYIFVILFAIIGAMRGWARELLVTFSVILAFFLINIMETIVMERFGVGIVEDKSGGQFWIRGFIISVLVFFGYQSPRIPKFAAAVKKEKISDSFLGFFLGAINGYLFAGTLWFYMDYANYPFEYFANPELFLELANIHPPAETAIAFISKLPPAWLGTEPGIYIAVGLAFLFVLVVFI
jgi:uncharacterized membrane protein required for colicin V production